MTENDGKYLEENSIWRLLLEADSTCVYPLIEYKEKPFMLVEELEKSEPEEVSIWSDQDQWLFYFHITKSK